MTLDTALLERTLLKAFLPLLAIGIVLFGARRRGLSWREGLGLTKPPLGQTVAWLALYVAWMLGSDRVFGWRGPWDFRPWAQAPLVVSGLRVLAVCILGPIAEELIFRGFLYTRLVGTRLGVAGSVVLLAAVWAAIHTSYSGGVVALIFVDGLLLGAARYRSGSLIVPILMHVVWNLYAIW
jgi:membrane protease YdiL (CAAX protease family)